jgi:RND family efflux transporter MFP subunit
MPFPFPSRAAFAIALSLASVACGRGRNEAAAAAAQSVPNVVAAKIEASDDTPLRTNGSVEPAARMHLGFRAPGIVRALFVKAGDRVSKGQLLGTLNATDAAARLRAAAADLAKAERDAQNAARLASTGAIAPLAREDAQSALEAARARHALALDAVDAARLVAPASGTIFQRVVEPGEAVAIGAPAVLLDDTDHVVVRTAVRSVDEPAIAVGQTVKLDIEGRAPVLARVRSVARVPTASSGMHDVEIVADARDSQALRPGVLVEVLFERGTRARSLHVPLEATVHRRDADWVFVLPGDASRVAVEARRVTVARIDGKQAEISDGVRADERIVAEGAYFLRDGEIVQVLP